MFIQLFDLDSTDYHLVYSTYVSENNINMPIKSPQTLSHPDPSISSSLPISSTPNKLFASA